MNIGRIFTPTVIFSIFILSLIGITAVIINANERQLVEKNEATIADAISYFKQKKSQVTIYEAEQHLKKVSKIMGKTDALSLKMLAAIEKLYDSDYHASIEEKRLNALDETESVFDDKSDALSNKQ